MAHTYKLIAKISDRLGYEPDKFSPMTLHGMDTNGVSPLFLGYLRNHEYPTTKITHIVAKMPGYSWYYNQYHGQQYAAVSVHIFEVVGEPTYDVEKGTVTWEVHSPWMEEFQKPREKK